MKHLEPLSIVVPTLNEADNMQQLLLRIDVPLRKAGIGYEVVVVDDHSSDNTVQISKALASKYPVRISLKKGKRGKAFSLLQGFDEAKYPLVVMIDADLQYAPEEIMPMYHLLEATNADVITTRRQIRDVSLLRNMFSKVYNFIFAKLLFGIDFDTQSGLKLFRKPILDNFKMDPSPWSFDLEFLIRALENRFKIISHDIVFSEREAGVTKIKLFSSTIELATAALKLRWRTSAPKTRAGYQANMRFVKRAFPLMALTLLFVLTLSAGGQQASALSLSDPVDKTTSLVAGLQNKVQTVLLPLVTTPRVSPISVTSPPTVIPTISPSPSSGSTNAPPSASTYDGGGSSSPAAGSGTASMSRSSETATSTAAPVIIPTSNSDTASTPISASDTATLSASTGSLYAAGYPNNKLSTSTTNKLNLVITAAWIVGASLIASFFVFYKRNRKPQQDVRI